MFSAKTYVEDVMQDCFVSSQQGKKKGEAFRVSSMPYCPFYDIVESATFRTESFEMDMYTETGTAIHENFQRYLPRAHFKHDAVGDWECTKCKKHYTLCHMPKACSCGGHEFVYQEHQYTLTRYGVTLSGHTDFLLQPDGDHFIVVDFKTTGMKYFTPYMKRFLPFAHNEIGRAHV